MSQNFVIVGAPGMGKSTLLQQIPATIHRATCVDFEHTSKPLNAAFLKNVALGILQGCWDGPLFLGNAGGDACAIAQLGFEVIALHHGSHEDYLRQMEKRDREYHRLPQGDFWPDHRKLFCETMPRNGIEPFIVDTLELTVSQSIDAIAKHFDLKQSAMKIVWITGPRAAGKTTTARAFSDVACTVDTDDLLAELNKAVPSEFRYTKYQSTQGFQEMDRAIFKKHLLEAWNTVKRSSRENGPAIVAGWHTQSEWLRGIILETHASGRIANSSFLRVIPSVEVLQNNIRRRNCKSEIAEWSGEEGKSRLRDTITIFNNLDHCWKRISDSNDLLDEIAKLLNVAKPPLPDSW